MKIKYVTKEEKALLEEFVKSLAPRMEFDRIQQTLKEYRIALPQPKKDNTAEQCDEMGIKIGDVIEGREGGESWWNETRLLLLWKGEKTCIWKVWSHSDKRPWTVSNPEASNWTLNCRRWCKVDVCVDCGLQYMPEAESIAAPQGMPFESSVTVRSDGKARCADCESKRIHANLECSTVGPTKLSIKTPEPKSAILEVYDRFKHLNRILTDCASDADPLHKTAADLWRVIKNEAQIAALKK